MAGDRRRRASLSDVFVDNFLTCAIVGAGAYVVGYILTFVFAVIDGAASSRDLATWKVVGWVYYGAHNVQLSMSQSAGGQSQSRSYSIFDMAGSQMASTSSGLTSTVPSVVYMLVPVVVLVGAGYVAYRQADTGRLATDRVVTLGASVVGGYFALSVVGGTLFRYSQSVSFGSQSVSISVGPDLTTAVLLMGLLYPLVLGGAGAVLARKRQQRRTATGQHRI